MLILVAVTVQVAVSSGLFGNTQRATGGWRDAQAQEQDISSGNMKITVEGVTYNSIEEFKATQAIPEDRSHLKVGDYVDYKPDTAEEYTLTSEITGFPTTIAEIQTIEQEQLQWRIMSINEDGSVDLISSTPTTSSVGLAGTLGYNNGVYILNDLCKKQYSNTSLGATARSLNLVDIENRMNTTGIATRDSYTVDRGDSTVGNPSLIAYYGKTYTYQDYDMGDGNGVQVASWLPDICEKTGTTSDERSKSYYTSPTTATGESKGTVTVTQTSYTLRGETNYFNDQIFCEMIFGTDSGYILATRGVNCWPDIARFDIFIIKGDSLETFELASTVNGLGEFGAGPIRPVVSLSSNVKISTEGGTAENPRSISI